MRVPLVAHAAIVAHVDGADGALTVIGPRGVRDVIGRQGPRQEHLHMHRVHEAALRLHGRPKIIAKNTKSLQTAAKRTLADAERSKSVP